MPGEYEDARQGEQSNEKQGSSHTTNVAWQDKVVVTGTKIFERLLCKTAEDNLGAEQTSEIKNAVCSDLQQHQPISEEENIEKFVQAFRKIADDIDREYDLQSMFNNFDMRSPGKTFTSFCTKMFSDRKLTWGGVVALFYFACKLIMKVAVEHAVLLMKDIFSSAINYFTENMSRWVAQHGGWGMIYEYWGTPTINILALGVVAACSVIYVLWKQR